VANPLKARTRGGAGDGQRSPRRGHSAPVQAVCTAIVLVALAGCAAGGGGDAWAAWFGRLHALTVPFPIALMIAGGVAELLHALRGGESYTQIVRFCVRFTAGAAVVAALLGWINAGWSWRFDAALTGLEPHRWLGSATAGWSVLLALLLVRAERRSDRPRRRVFRAALLIGIVLVVATAHFGGMIVFGPGYFAPP
jgi:uncharacterized membrane protein